MWASQLVSLSAFQFAHLGACELVKEIKDVRRHLLSSMLSVQSWNVINIKVRKDTLETVVIRLRSEQIWISLSKSDRYHLDKEEMFGTTWGLPSLKRSGPANFYFHISTSKTFKIFSHILKFQDFQLTFFQDDFCWWDQRALCNFSGSFITQLVRYHRFVVFRECDFSKGKTFDLLFIFVICFRKWTSRVTILITFTNQCSFIWN